MPRHGVKTDEKSNEITAIPQLPEVPDLHGCIITIDAMGCQREIAQQITPGGADYVLAVKENQGQLHEGIRDRFEGAAALGFDGAPYDYVETVDKGHGRVERRECRIITDQDCLDYVDPLRGPPRTVATTESGGQGGGPSSDHGRQYRPAPLLHQQPTSPSEKRGCRDVGVRWCEHQVGGAVNEQDLPSLRSGAAVAPAPRLAGVGLPEDHPAYFISDIVDQPDLSEITARYEQERRDGPPYHPRMMVKALLYAYCVGAPSSRRIASRLHEDIAFRALAANNTPDFRTVSDFRKDHLDALSGLFLQVLLLCQREGPVKLGHVALDGAKVRANASQHKAMSYQRMKEKEAQLAAEVDELLRRAQEVDEEEDRRYGKDRRGDELPEELAFREGRLEKIREAMAALEAEARAEAERAEAEGKEHPGVPDDKAQRNFTDPESRIMPGPGGRNFLQAYNCQAVVDHEHQVIIASRATNRASDKRPAVADLQDLGVDPFIAPEQTRHGHRPPPAPRGRIPKALSPRDRMRRKLRTKRGRQRYALRMATVEPVFGQIKQGRGFRQFLLRGLEKVNGEWSLICTRHNLLKLFKFGNSVVNPGRPAFHTPRANSPATLPLPPMANPWTGC